MKYIKNKNGKFIPVKQWPVRIIVNQFGRLFISASGEMIRGVEHPFGDVMAYETAFSK